MPPVLLVVDDDEGIREALHVLLDDDYHVLDASDGRMALSTIQARRVDLVILDILMPEVDGIEVLKELRALEPHLPVIMLTAVKTVRTAVAAMRLGAADYITKPFEDEEVLAAIRRMLERPLPGRLARAGRRRSRLERLPRSHRVLVFGGSPGWRATLAVAVERVSRVEGVSTLIDGLNQILEFRPTCVLLNAERSSAEVAGFLGALHGQLPLCPVLAVTDDPHLLARSARESFNIRAVIRPTALPREVLSAVAAVIAPGADGNGGRLQLGDSVSQAIGHIGGHFREELSVNALAGVAGISGSHLAHVFRTEMGMTVRDFVTRVRVEIAKEMLSRTDEKLETIAAFVGFFDASHLSRVFRKIRRQRPSTYRRSARKPA